LAAARAHRVPLVVAKVDRLTRSVAFLSRLLEAGVDVRFADLPMVEGATGRFLLQQMAAVAELEAGMISARTKGALAAAKRRGVQLGGDRGSRPTNKQRAIAIAVRQDRADARAADLAPVVKELRAAGAVTLRAIATGLDERGIPAARGGSWSANQVARLLKNIASPFGSAVAKREAAAIVAACDHLVAAANARAAPGDMLPVPKAAGLHEGVSGALNLRPNAPLPAAARRTFQSHASRKRRRSRTA
jgi:DNA invertase Pin-like site-specific DNA recombinase